MPTIRTPSTPAVALEALHNSRTGRIDASRVAEFLAVPVSRIASALDASYPAVHKTPDAASLQERLGPIKRALELVSQVTRDRREALAWLNNPHPDLGNDTPLQVLLRGHANVLVTLLENAIAGVPS
jgi:antitoxin Xre/MbcA/ParS-like protein